jgi:hypothetical protein
VLGGNVFELKLHRLGVEDLDGGSVVKLEVLEGDQQVEVEGRGVGVVEALYNALLARYAREYQSLNTIQLTNFQVNTDIGTKTGQAGVDAVAQVTLDVSNSEGRQFSFHDSSRSVTASTARAVLAMVQFFVNAERAFITLYNARRDGRRRREHELRRGHRQHPQRARIAEPQHGPAASLVTWVNVSRGEATEAPVAS